ncbi:MAG: RdgB/HAM1 family non-canonical purine NTP pyrophosphatase [Candidatus Puniceispirillum sp.]|nr:RdgB/HAM1 family non-canonical purine NTP pyrophosphatase [Candidatus Puniceispirillum sp.]MBL6774740.1 RdgB/HAM1 family non-canonical purine NTP pyrophosphatase [Candidatus Puniceispirillum sp.]
MTDRLFTEDTLVIATHNAGKMREIKALFAGFGINILSASELGLDEPDETDTSFIGNALLKARAAAMSAGQPALADDSGLCVTALDGAPGIYSARWAGPKRDFSLAMTAVETALAKTGNGDSGAEFVCALALVWPDGDEVCVEGRVKGQITFPRRGKHGFGYDPIFQPDGYQISFGEMDPDAKHAISHRADAFAQLLARCFGNADGG